MKQILMIEVSPRGKESASRTVTDTLTTRLNRRYPAATHIRRDLTKDGLPHLDHVTLRAITTRDPAEAAQLKETAKLSDHLTDELLASDLLVIATPMWNFGIPSALKAWIDLVVRPGKTFNYAGEGVVGLATGKKAVLVLASGGIFSDGPWRPFDFVEPYLRHVLSFIGIVDVQIIRAEGTNLPSISADVMPKANRAVEALSL